MVIMGEKGRVQSSRKLLFRADEYDTIRTRTILPLKEIKTANREMKRRRTVRITKTPGDNEGYR